MDQKQLNKLLSVCINVAKEAGDLIVEMAQKPFEINNKAEYDLVTSADKAANTLIEARLSEYFPDSFMMSEEIHPTLPSKRGLKEGILWIIDPIDGTANYAKHAPHCAVSIAAYDLQSQQLLVGCVNNPFVKECYYASLGGGAFLNDKSISVSTVNRLDRKSVG